MTISLKSFKLLLAGNTNVFGMTNVIIRSTLQLRQNEKEKDLSFRQIHIFHTEESLHSLINHTDNWQSALSHYDIPITSIIHHVTKIEDSSVERFRDLVEQLRTIVNPLDNASYYVDLTGGISALKTILAVFAYVLDIEHIYSLEIKFSDIREIREKQTKLFYKQLEQELEQESITYRKFPPIREFDDFGRRHYTEVIRHRQIIDGLSDKLSQLVPLQLDHAHLRSSLLSGTNSRLLGEVSQDSYSYRHAVFSFSAAIEETANALLLTLARNDVGDKTLGDKLADLRTLFLETPKYFVNAKVLEHLTLLIAEMRNSIIHPSPGDDKTLAEIQSLLASQLALTFTRFAIKTLSAFLDSKGNLVEIEVLSPNGDQEEIYYFGFDGDATGDYLEAAFTRAEYGEQEVLLRSKAVHNAIKALKKVIYKSTKSDKAVLFAEGDNILFKARYNALLLQQLQELYKNQTGLCSSIGYGRTLHEATIALRLAKAQKGDSALGIALRDVIGQQV
ncbi:MAG: mCpol domain-containing protein [Anaerolineae bacterium]|nr:mCpol domain-containing protein [Anaerolineae bacterium]